MLLNRLQKKNRTIKKYDQYSDKIMPLTEEAK